MIGDSYYLCNVESCHFNYGRTCKKVYLEGQFPKDFATESCEDRSFVKKTIPNGNHIPIASGEWDG